MAPAGLEELLSKYVKVVADARDEFGWYLIQEAFPAFRAGFQLLKGGGSVDFVVRKGVALYWVAVCQAITEARLVLLGGPPGAAGEGGMVWVDVAPYCVRLASMVPADMESAAGELRLYEQGRCHRLFDSCRPEGSLELLGFLGKAREHGFGAGSRFYLPAMKALHALVARGEIRNPPEPPRPSGYGGFAAWANKFVEVVCPFLHELGTVLARQRATAKKRPGRTKPSEEEVAKDAKLYTDWEAARSSGVGTFKEFARARGLDHKKGPREIRQAVERHRKRQAHKT